ncbi:MAG: hypothetical protein ABIH11_04435 [Candidatus Altiarchaeota archaeon]
MVHEDDGSGGSDRKIYARVFDSTHSMDDAVNHFNSNAKKPLIGLFGIKESVSEVYGRYAPTGCFELVRHGAVSAGSSGGDRNEFYVNMNSGVIYIVHKGAMGKAPSLRSTNLLRRIMDLPEESISLLADVFEMQSVPFSDLASSYSLNVGNRMDFLVLLRNRGLVSMTPDGKNIVSHISLPRFSDAGYQLERLVESRDSVDSDFESDPIKYASDVVLSLMEVFFRASGVFKGVIYLPYYVGVYVNELREQRSSVLYPLKFRKVV